MAAAESCKKRSEHLKVGCTPPTPASEAQWRKSRVDRMLVEHFLRVGYYDSALILAKHFDIEELTNINLFLVAKDVEDALANKDVGKCLTWCHDNKSKLRKMRSNLEFNVRLQEFVEMIKAGKKGMIHSLHFCRKISDKNKVMNSEYYFKSTLRLGGEREWS